MKGKDLENSKEYLKELKRKLSANKFIEELNQITNMANNKQVRNNFNNEMVNKTWQYQKKYGFETSPRQGHEFWNNEADAFKHAFGSAEMFFNMGKWGSLAGGIYHENETPNNPQGEWNMDSWNNNQGREIAKDILKQYGNQVYKMSDKQRSDLIAEKIMEKMRSGKLITKPDDPRKYDGKVENIINEIKKRWDGNLTGQALPIEPFTRQQIGRMTPDEFARNEALIMEQLRNGQIIDEADGFFSQTNDGEGCFGHDENGKYTIYDSYGPDDNALQMFFTREDIGSMSSAEFAKNESAIMAQLKEHGIPSERDLPKESKKSASKSNGSSKDSGSADGKWVTINGNHVLIKN